MSYHTGIIYPTSVVDGGDNVTFEDPSNAAAVDGSLTHADASQDEATLDTHFDLSAIPNNATISHITVEILAKGSINQGEINCKLHTDSLQLDEDAIIDELTQSLAWYQFSYDNNIGSVTAAFLKDSSFILLLGARNADIYLDCIRIADIEYTVSGGGTQTLYPTAIASGEVFGTAVVGGGVVSYHTGIIYPTSVVDGADDIKFNVPFNAKIVDGNCATATVNEMGAALSASGFDFSSIPNGATIVSVVVKYLSRSNRGAFINYSALVIDGVSVESFSCDSNNGLVLAWHQAVFNDAAITTAFLKDSSFHLYTEWMSQDSSDSQIDVDCIRIADVEYTTGGGALQTLYPSAITTLEAFGTSIIGRGTVTIAPSGIVSSESFGSGVIGMGGVTISPGGIASPESFGTTMLTPGVMVISPAGIPSAEGFGVTAISAVIIVLPSGIGSAQTFGLATLSGGVMTIVPSSIASGESFGTATIAKGALTVSPSGILTSETFGLSTIAAAIIVSPGAIASLQSFGTAQITTGPIQLSPSGIGSAESFGSTLIQIGKITLSPASIVSLESFGVPALSKGVVIIRPTMIPSMESFGIAIVKGGLFIDCSAARLIYIDEENRTVEIPVEIRVIPVEE